MPKLGNTLKARVFGVTFLALCVLFVYLTYAVFTKKFTPYDEVTLQSSKIGLSLPARADVKVRGVLVGEVLETVTDGDGAKLTLGLFPDMRESVPADVTGRILPKTLFGEKYVSLEVPDGEATGAEPIEVGAVIKQAEVAIEVEEVLNDLFPLLRAVRPGDLNVTLNAIATALEGRGDKLGEGLETFNSYLGKLNPEIPALVESLDQLGQVSAVYEDVVPEVARLLRNTVKTTQTFESEADRDRGPLRRRGRLRRHHARLPGEERRQHHHPVRPGTADPAAAGPLLARVQVLPARSGGEHRAERERLPQQDPAHQARDRAPAAWLQRRRPAAVQRQPRAVQVLRRHVRRHQRQVLPGEPAAALADLPADPATASTTRWASASPWVTP